MTTDTCPHLGKQIMELLKLHATTHPNEYVNPWFLVETARLLEVHFKLEDDVVDKWIQQMFGH